MNYTLQHLRDAPNVPADLDGKIIFTSEKFEVVHLTLVPGQGMDPHAMPFEIVFFVKEGEGRLFVDHEEIAGVTGDCISVKAGDCISVKAGILRGWRNTGTEPLKLIVMKILK